MNNARRKAIQKAISNVQQLIEDVSSLQQEEQDYLDNMSENMRDSEKGSVADAANESLLSAVGSLEEAITHLEEAGVE